MFSHKLVKIVYNQRLEQQSEHPTGRPKATPPHAQPIDNNATVVRSDAAWAGQRNTAGLGWTILESRQNKDFQLSMDFGASSLMAEALAHEALALREELLSCRRLELKLVRFESDSAQLIKAITSKIGFSEIYSVVSDILELANVFEDVSFVWISRERNNHADSLAKGALNVPELLVGFGAVNAPN
ncbi:hypothetical protein DY000_02037319 [Brassica cretica]|uniref:RNase H type-1 domain-containing protein n=1 Tax=Brassica cretica TaxID=69181 RepID=A0ABQ7B6R5_BRACR|nr:hypothetical protein DY000_02037319 [Brassica cretica]